ncbi:hypothetical protein [Pukyongiella litopenaei]|uniref:Uncharacterized protein n=1 Tax=Pukyongiella litopenaei TaxID=2605946 RepID=A0A2S0MTZ0_9RHOB|nr:hypothetical protein [Pukyongiella litopenaei]AVO39163.1 hypothetical protein C6Y53_16555 [Pukyongiella litopenaei]
MRINAALAVILLPLAAAAQAPLSAIEWLNEDMPPVRQGPVLSEPPVSDGAALPPVSVTPLAERADPVGLVSAKVTGLPPDLWERSGADELAAMIARTPVEDSPAMQTLLYTLLLSETRPPPENGEALLLARLDRLLDLGAVDAAQALAEHAGTGTPARFARWFDATLLTGDEDASCADLLRAPHLSPGYDAMIACTARAGDWSTAALLLETAHALDLLPKSRLALLDRFLSPEIFEDAAPLPAPEHPDPLGFRLHEAIGERLTTSRLPRVFATADLRDVAGWKAQIEAAERLARMNALSPNRLLGLYTERAPAASGGVWDRVAALQAFESALGRQDADAVAATLPPVWDAMRDVRLEVAFATLFAEQLAKQRLDDPRVNALAWRIRLLSADYETAARQPPDDSPATGFLTALAEGDPGTVPAPDATAEAIAEGFAPGAKPPAEILHLLETHQLGAAILRAISLLDRGAEGDPTSLSGALATLRAVGLEDSARRAALQLMLLDRHRA